MTNENIINKRPFSAEIDREPGYVILSLHGDLDADGSQSLKTFFNSNIKDSDRFIIFEMTDVPYINSTALGVIIAFHKMMEVRDGQIFIVNAQKRVKNVFAIMSLSDKLLFLDDIESAVKLINT